MELFLLAAAALALVATQKDKLEETLVTSKESFTRYDELFRRYGRSNWRLLKAIAMNESSLGEDQLVKAGLASRDGKSWGLMQLTIATAHDYDPSVSTRDLNDPEVSVRLAAALVQWLQTQFSTVDARYTEWVVKSYNQGIGNTKKEMAGQIKSKADAYWARFQRNLKVIENKQGVSDDPNS